MTNTNNFEFKWDNFTKDVNAKRVIPVIGKQLYQVEIDPGGKKYFLYKYLTEALASEFKIKIPKSERYKFQSICHQFLKKNNNDYDLLTDFLKEQFQKMSLIPERSLWKLARIRSFDLFMTTAYDGCLLQTLKRVRTSLTDTLFFMGNEILYKSCADEQEFNKIPYSKSNLVFHLFGNFDSTVPAYTKEDIIASIKTFREKFERHDEYFFNLFRRMVGRQLLFLGFEYDDWLFKYLICIMSSIALDKKEATFKLLIGDDFKKDPLDPFYQLLLFLEEKNAVHFYPNENGNFVDLLFKKMRKKYPEDIIKPNEYPVGVFISYERTDQPKALALETQLTQDGFSVWYDKKNLRGGNNVHEDIINAIEQCSVFIPITSQNTNQQVDEEGKLRYHIKEWQIAFGKFQRFKNKEIFKIIPVVLDSIKNLYDEFRDFAVRIIPNGTDGEYEDLKKDIQIILRKYHD